MKSVRIWFKKAGLAVYISHLDMNRCFSRAVIRARLPLWYTEGFNPKPYLNFLAPLPLGQVGLLEPLDIRIVGEITFEEICLQGSLSHSAHTVLLVTKRKESRAGLS